jgi:hypothetical protein
MLRFFLFSHLRNMKLVNRNRRRDFADMCINFFSSSSRSFFFICPLSWDLECYEIGRLYIADTKLT